MRTLGFDNSDLSKRPTTAMAKKTISPARMAAAALLLLAGAASAQTLFRSVGPDGRVTYSDRAPASASGKATVERRLESPASAPSATLPYELREVASRYPVTLYTAADCAPCAGARAVLGSRGVPFTERTVGSNEDIAALKALGGDGSLPYATLGSQPLHGFDAQEWQRTLDAAGYPKTSQLPANWRAVAATPLAPRVQAAAAAAPAAPLKEAVDGRAAAGGVNARNEDRSSNPAGIRF